jgi:MFS family permease
MLTRVVLRPRFGGLWRHRAFMTLWTGQTISVFGSYVGGFALDLTAIIVLKAAPTQMTLLLAAGLLPGLLLGLVAGVWVDRLPHRPLLIGADVGRALVLATIPIAALLRHLRIEHLYLAALLMSALTVVFEVAYRSYLPSLISREELVEGNSKLQASASAAEFAGFGVSGLLVQTLTAPLALLIDACSFLVSALAVAAIGPASSTRDELRAAPEGVSTTWSEIAQGLRFVIGDAVVRSVAATSGTLSLFWGMIGVVIMLYVIRGLHLAPALLGPIFALGGVSALFGAAAAPRIVERWGVGRAAIGSLLVASAAALCLPLAGGPIWLAAGLLVAQQLCGDGAVAVYQITAVSLLQAVTPDCLQGRMNATSRVIEGGGQAAGLIVGGFLGQTIGLRPTLLVAVVGSALAVLWLIYSPVRTLRAYPADPG